METVNINGLPLGIKEYKGHRVVTFRDIDMVHCRPREQHTGISKQIVNILLRERTFLS